MEHNNKIPFIKCDKNHFKVIKPLLEMFGYKTYKTLCYNIDDDN